MSRLNAGQRDLVERHVPLAEKLARARCRYGREDLADVRSDALWGLTLAGRAFRPGPATFLPYACMRIENAIKRGRQIRSGLPRTAWESADRPRRVSLQSPVGADGVELGDLLPDAVPMPDQALSDAVRRLPARERLVVKLRYLWGFTQVEVAPVIGCSQMHVSRIERAALGRLRESLAA